MCWWKVHSKCRKCTIFLHILRLICFVREKWLKEFLRKLTVHSECYIIWWEKWQRRQRLKDSFVFGFHYYGNNITFHPSSSSNIVSSFNPCCYFFFSFMHLDINKLKYSILCLFFIYFFLCTCLHRFWLLTTTCNDSNYLNSLYLFQVYLFLRRVPEMLWS